LKFIFSDLESCQILWLSEFDFRLVGSIGHLCWNIEEGELLFKESLEW
jgi:hypothetical protein